MSQKIYPLTFEPQFQDYIWGGRNLAELFGRDLPPGIVAESWEISGHPTAPTRADRGHWQGRTLPEILNELGLDLVGSNSRDMLQRQKFPLLLKLLDANRDLSVQVHPNDAYAAEHEQGELGKTEMWYVLHAEPDARLIYGLASGVTPDSFGKAVAEERLETQLHYLPIETGDSIFVPSGAIHALLAGVVVAEIQQNSDTTYRVYDWGRKGDDGRPRPLHLDKALDVIDWSLIEPDAVEPETLRDSEGVRRLLLVECDRFVVERVDLSPGAMYAGECDGSTFEIWGWIEGRGAIDWAGQALQGEAIRFVLLPAALGAYRVRATAPSSMLRIYVR